MGGWAGPMAEGVRPRLRACVRVHARIHAWFGGLGVWHSSSTCLVGGGGGVGELVHPRATPFTPMRASAHKPVSVLVCIAPLFSLSWAPGRPPSLGSAVRPHARPTYVPCRQPRAGCCAGGKAHGGDAGGPGGSFWGGGACQWHGARAHSPASCVHACRTRCFFASRQPAAVPLVHAPTPPPSAHPPPPPATSRHVQGCAVGHL